MKKKTCIVVLAALIAALALAAGTKTEEEPKPALALAGELTEIEGGTYLAVTIDVRKVTGLNASRVDVEYDIEALEMIAVLDDVDIDETGRQNFLGASVLSVNEIVEAGVSEYAVSKIWSDGAAPAGSSGDGSIGLLVFRILKPGPTTIGVRRDTLKLLADKDTPIPEWSDEFIVEALEYDPAE